MVQTSPSLETTHTQELLGRVHAATGPDRELDADITTTLRYCRPGFPEWAANWDGPFVANLPGKGMTGRVALGHSNGEFGLHWAPEALTASLDAALALVERMLPGRSIEMAKYSDGRAYVSILTAGKGNAPTLPLALLAALLAALGVGGESTGRGLKPQHTGKE